MITLTDDGAAVTASLGGTELFRYVYRPADPPLESPRPYFHPVRTLAGKLVTTFRPEDHVWHKGIALSLPNVGPDNFWGGATYRRGDGYIQVDNNGSMDHRRFSGLAEKDGGGLIGEELTWHTQGGAELVSERRDITVTAWPDQDAWALGFTTTLTNISGRQIRIGSPTTEGRDNAGYGGLFWRGPASFTGGEVITPDGPGGDECMGRRGPWLGFTGQDGAGAPSTVLFADTPGNIGYPGQWFVRSTPFACICPAPFFGTEHPLAPAGVLTLSYRVIIADGRLGPGSCATLAGRELAGRE